MGDREKLMDLICGHNAVKCDGEHGKCLNFADYLLANGVTLQRWIPVTEQKPPENTRVLLFIPNVAEGGKVRIGVLEPINLWFTEGRDRLLYSQVTHWMPLPEAPKEEES